MTEEVKSTTTVLTSENAAEFYAKKLDLEPPKPDAAQTVESPKEEIKAEEAKEEKKEEVKETPEEKEKREKKEKLNLRFSDLTEKRKAAEARAAEAEAKAQEALKKAAELEAKLNPPKEDVEPDPKDFPDAFAYNKALVKWELAQRDKAEAEKQEKARQETQRQAWMNRLESFKSKTEDYDDVIAASTVIVSEEMKQSIWESDAGPHILYYLAQHPEEAERMSKLTVGGMWREMGKLEAKLTAPAEPKKEEKKAEVSRAPEPITPLTGGKGAIENLMDAQGNFLGTPKQYRDLRRAGKIH